MKSEKPESEFDVNHVKARGYAEDPMGPGEILRHQEDLGEFIL